MPTAQPWVGLPAQGPMIRSPWKYTGESRSGYYARAAKGIVPPPVKIGENISAVPKGWLDAFIAACASEGTAA